MNSTTHEHDWFTEQIGGYLAGALDDAERARFEAHAAGCESCNAELEATRQMEIQMTAALTGIAPAADFEDQIVQRLRMNLTHRRWVHPMVRRVAATVAAAVVVAGIGLVGQEFLKTGKWPDVQQLAASVNPLQRAKYQRPKTFDDTTKLASDQRSAAKMLPDVTLGNGVQPTGGDVSEAMRQLLRSHEIAGEPFTTLTSNAEKWDFGGGTRGELGWEDANGRSSGVTDGAVFGAAPSGGSLDLKLGTQSDVRREPVAVAGSFIVATDGDGDGKDATAVHRYFSVDNLDKSLEGTPSAHPTLTEGASRVTESQRVSRGEVDKTVRDLIGQSRQLTADGQYGDAVKVLDQIQALDPNNDYAKGAKPLVEDRALVESEKAAGRGRMYRRDDILSFPADWPDLSEKRERTVAIERGERAEDTAILAQLDKKLPEVRFENTALGDVVEFMRDVSTADIFVDWERLEEAGIDRTTPVTGRFRDQRISDALAAVLQQAGGDKANLGYQIDNGVIVVTPVANQAADHGAAQNPATQAATTQAAGPGKGGITVVAPAPVIRKVIREGVVEYEVDSFDSAFNTITKLTAEEGGFIAAADSNRLDNGKVRGVVTVRVPPDRLDILLLKLRGLGDLKSQRLGSKDISKQYTDMESELRASRAMEERLLEMIKTSKGKVAELLEAEKELGNQRAKIEKIQGELNYYNNLVSMATLTITASEKDIRTPASASQTEEVNTGIETSDVEHARTEIIKSIDEVKGRIVESELKQLEAGQLAAKVVADVAPEHAGPIIDRLKQLGKVARLDIQRKQTNANTAPGSTAPQKIEQAPTRLIISMYNLANVAPRLTTNMTLGAEDVEATYRGIIRRVRDAEGRVLSSNLNRQDATQVNGNVQFEVKSADADAVLNDIRNGPGAAALTVNVTENPDTANVTTAKQAFTVQIIAAGRVAPREVRVLAVQTSDVEGAMQKVIAAAQNSKGRVTESSISQDANGKQLARIAIELPLGSVDQMVDFARQQGKVRTAEASKNSQVPDGPLARARIMLSIGSGDTIVPAESGFWASIREGLSTSVRGLLWSLQLIVIGLCLIGPWVLIGWGGLRFWRRRRASQPA